MSRKNLTSTLCDRTLDLLKNRSVKLTYQKIENDTAIPAGWLRMFARNKIPNPGVCQIQTLYEYLSKKQLEF